VHRVSADRESRAGIIGDNVFRIHLTQGQGFRIVPQRIAALPQQGPFRLSDTFDLP
jgi:hypothetical protein